MISPYMQQRRAMKNGTKNTDQQQRVEDREKNGKQANIKKESDKRKQLNKEYAAVSKPLWKGKDCQAKMIGCTGKAQGMHHIEGKENAEKLLNMKKAIPCCNHCNGEIERLHAIAKEKGLKEKRNVKTKRYDNTYKK